MVVYLCCKGLLPMFHLCFSDACCKCVYLDVAYISHIRCMCVFRCFLSISVACFKCFIYFYVATAEFGCFKSRFWVLHPSSPSVTSSWCVPLSTPAGHSYDAAAGSFRIGGAARPLLLLSLGRCGPRVERVRRSAAHSPSICPDAHTAENLI
jgi:hypothetical protein